MSHRASQSAILFLVLCVMAEAFDFGKYQPLYPSSEEKELCKKHANGRNLEKVYKVVTNAFDVGKFQPLTPSEEEKEICKDNAYGREITSMYKKVWNTCYIQCLYEGESKAEAFLTPDGTLCCDIVGIGPTGNCYNGKCVPFWRQLAENL